MVDATTTYITPAAAGGRLKYADPRTLPSFPSSGLREDGAAAGAAASLGWSNQKPVEPWRPDKSSASSAAAALAKDYKMAPVWEPSTNSTGRKAALLAVGSASAALKQPSSPRKDASLDGTWGNSAATQAFNASRASTKHKSDLSPGNSAATQAFNTDRSLSHRKSELPAPADISSEERSLAAAKGAMSVRRPRATSSPTASALKLQSSRDKVSTTNALRGATTAHRASMTSAVAGNAGAVPVTTMTRNMFTSNPPVKPEVVERDNNDKIHASAVAMAKKMYSQQQRMVDQTKEAHASGTTSQGAGQFMNLQDAAYKQAQERLAKIHAEYSKNREFQEYYGAAEAQAPRRRFSVAGRLRRRSSSDSDFDDSEESAKIRKQMSMFSSKVSQIDEGKRQKDRDAVLAAAQRNVKARLQGMDEKVYKETGRANSTLITDWELKAQAAAQDRHESRTVNKGKVDIGGGRFMNPEEVEAIASSRVQPVLDEINEKADAERERRLALKMEEEAKKEEEGRRREREKEIQQLNQQAKDEERQQLRAQRAQEKADEKERKDKEKARKAEEKRMTKEIKRRSKQQDSAEADIDTQDPPFEVPHDAADTVALTGGETTAPTINTGTPGNTHQQTPESPASPTSPTSKVKGWIKNRFSRGKSLSETGDKRRSFFGGAALRDAETNGSSVSLDHRANSMRDVALAGKAAEHEERSGRQRGDSRGVSLPSTPGAEPCDPLATAESMPMTPPKPIADPLVRTSVSPSRDSRFREEIS